MDELEKRAIGAGVVTYDGLQPALIQCLQSTGLTNLAEKLSNGTESTVTVEDDNQLPSIPSLCWGGRFRRVPPDFQLPDCSVAALWVSWMCGNASKKLPPLRMLDGRDMPSRNLQKRLSDARYLMTSIESEAKPTGLWQANPTHEDAVKIFTSCASISTIPDRTAQRRKRRSGQLSWTTVVALHRRSNRPQNHE
ncbi:hypothetical protein AM587_10002337 [Phytophthora nicotianae]|uniref:Uncharacterized protein n=1 Tax=Phytophthora nicotianae TaxID=4792 RepID=A0A0W8DY76_PHYNI|nr:hypothetical protein AM587_10002337 [Phytophthora nicotianae]